MKYVAGTRGDHTFLQYGREMEEKAKERYKEITGLSVIKSGLVIRKGQEWLCASPDGFVERKNDVCVLEIKCPFSCRGKQINVPYWDKEKKLKKTHEY